MGVYQNIGTPRYYGLNGLSCYFPSIEKSSGVKQGYKKNGYVVGGWVNGTAFEGTDNFTRYQKQYCASSNCFYSINNFNNIQDNVLSGGLAILCVPVRVKRGQWKFDIVNNKYYQYINSVEDATIDSYETYDYFLLSNIKYSDNTTGKYKTLYELSWKSNSYDFDDGELDGITEGVNTKNSYEETQHNISLSIFNYITGNGEVSTSLKNIDGESQSYTYNKYFDGELAKFKEDWAKYNSAYIGTPITATQFPYSTYDGFPALSFPDTIYRKITTNIPVFKWDNLEGLFNYFSSGSLVDADNANDIELLELDWSTDWTLYVDGKQPNLKLVWHSDALEQYLENPELNLRGLSLYDIKVEISQNLSNGERKVISYSDYTDGYFKTDYGSLAESFNPTEWDKFLAQVIGSQTGIGDIPIYFRLFYGQIYSAMCYCTIPYARKPTEYGLLPDLEITDNSTVTIVYGSDGSEDDGYIPPTEESDIGNESEGTEGIDVSGVMATTYVMTNERIRSLSAFLWNDSFFDNIKLLNNSPIENVVSCKVMPLSVTGTDEQIVLGNVETGVNGDKTTSSKRVEIGELNIPLYYKSFLDFAPFTKLTIFLPFIGFKELDTNLFMNKTLKVYYVFDFVTGAIKVQLYSDNVYVCSFDGNGGIDIPLTSSNRAQVESGYIRSALTIGASLATGNAVGVAMGALDIAQNTYHYNTNGSFSPSCGFHDSKTIYVIYDRPTAQYPTTYNHNVGKPCELSRSLSSLTGFTTVKKGIDVSGIACTESEREEIISLLTTGIYL